MRGQKQGRRNILIHAAPLSYLGDVCDDSSNYLGVEGEPWIYTRAAAAGPRASA